MIIYIINCVLLMLSGIVWGRSDMLNLFIKVVFFIAALYNGFEAYRFYVMGV